MASNLLSFGWFVSDDYATSNENLTERNLLNVDIKEFSKAALSPDAAKGKSAEINGPVILQVQKVRNVFSPKVNEDRDQGGVQMLRVTLSDGHSTFIGLDLNNAVKGLNLKTVPGTKLRLKGRIRCEKGFIMLARENCEVLGGHVEDLVQKWKMSKETSMSSYKERGSGGTNAPRWVPFGKIIVASDDLKAGRIKNPSASDAPQEASAFDKSRKSTIADIQATGTASARDFQAGRAQVHEKMQSSARQQANQRASTAGAGYLNGNVPSESTTESSQKSAPSSHQQHQQLKKLNAKDFKRLDKFDIFEDADYEPNDSELKRPAGALNLFDFVSQKVGKLKLEDDPPFSDGYSSSQSHNNNPRPYSDRQTNSSSSYSKNSRERDQLTPPRSTNSYRFDSKPAFSTENRNTGHSKQSAQTRYPQSSRRPEDNNYSSNNRNSTYDSNQNKQNDRYQTQNIRNQHNNTRPAEFPVRIAQNTTTDLNKSNYKGSSVGKGNYAATNSKSSNGYAKNSNAYVGGPDQRGSGDVRRYQNNNGGRPQSTASRNENEIKDASFPALRAPLSSSIPPPVSKSSETSTNRPNSKPTQSGHPKSSPTANNQCLPVRPPVLFSKPQCVLPNHPPPSFNYPMPPPSHQHPPPPNFPPPSIAFSMPPPPNMLPVMASGPPPSGGMIWTSGMRCLARHPADGRFCEASVVAPAMDHCVVHLQDFNQNVRVGVHDLLPLHNNMPGISFH